MPPAGYGQRRFRRVAGRLAPGLPEDDLKEIFGACQSDPVFFFRQMLRADPWEKQQEILRALSIHRRVAVRSCHASGKSWLAAGAALWFLQSFPDDTIVATTAPTFRQVEKVIWPEIKAHLSRAAAAGVRFPGRVLETEIKIGDKWFAFGVATNDPNRLQGLHAKHVLIIVDEASGISPEMWEAIEANLSGGAAHLLMIGNPTDPTSQFAREFTLLPPGAKFAISAFDTPNLRAGRIVVPGLISPEWVEDKKRRWGESSPMYVARVLGNFPPAAPDALIPLSWIERAHLLWEQLAREEEARRAAGEPEPETRAELGCDIARQGDDFSVFAVKRGRRVAVQFSANGLDTMDTAGRIMALARELGCAPKVDVIGIGAGVVDRIREGGMQCHEMNVAEAAMDDERFVNLRSEWFWQLREAFEEGRIALDPNDVETAHELSALRYRFTAGRIRLEPKDEMKKRLGHSPDRADAVMLAWATPPERGPLAAVVGAVAVGMPPVVIPPT